MRAPPPPLPPLGVRPAYLARKYAGRWRQWVAWRRRKRIRAELIATAAVSDADAFAGWMGHAVATGKPRGILRGTGLGGAQRHLLHLAAAATVAPGRDRQHAAIVQSIIGTDRSALQWRGGGRTALDSALRLGPWAVVVTLLAHGACMTPMKIGDFDPEVARMMRALKVRYTILTTGALLAGGSPTAWCIRLDRECGHALASNAATFLLQGAAGPPRVGPGAVESSEAYARLRAAGSPWRPPRWSGVVEGVLLYRRWSPAKAALWPAADRRKVGVVWCAARMLLLRQLRAGGRAPTLPPELWAVVAEIVLAEAAAARPRA